MEGKSDNANSSASDTAQPPATASLNSESRRILSLRRELNERQIQSLKAHYHDPNEDLSKYSRETLESEVRLLRRELSEVDKRVLDNAILLRDILSHESGGKDDVDYLHINQTDESPKQKQDFMELVRAAGKRALGGGMMGALAMAAQVTALMWMRSTMNYQYRHGTTTLEAMRTLYAQGGIPRFYRGYIPALVQGPMSRFGDTAANSGVISLLDSLDSTKHLPTFVKTIASSMTAALWRIFLMPVDTLKTILQVEGQQGYHILVKKIRESGVRTLYHGAMGAYSGTSLGRFFHILFVNLDPVGLLSATLVGHFPWFFTLNSLDQWLPRPEKDAIWRKLGRNALMGFCASAVSDTISNSLRVVKTTKQTYERAISYREAVNAIVEKDGYAGLFGRGLKTRILTNGLQGIMFTVLWKGMEDAWNKK